MGDSCNIRWMDGVNLYNGYILDVAGYALIIVTDERWGSTLNLWGTLLGIL